MSFLQPKVKLDRRWNVKERRFASAPKRTFRDYFHQTAVPLPAKKPASSFLSREGRSLGIGTGRRDASRSRSKARRESADPPDHAHSDESPRFYPLRRGG